MAELEKRRGPGFRISHMLVLTALIAICLTWPIFAIYAVPLLLGVTLSRFGFGSIPALVVAAALSVVLGITFSCYYWRYPFHQPKVLKEFRDISSVEQLSHVVNLNTQKANVLTVVGLAAVPPASKFGWNTSYEISANDRILRELRERGIEIQSSQPMVADELLSVWNVADRAGLLIDGDAGYSDTKTLWGHIGKAQLYDGTKVLFAALEGMEHSNDHYPYYEFVIPLDGEPAISNHQWFFEDISGIEGFNWTSFATLAFAFLLAPLAIVFGIARGVWRLLANRRRQARLDLA